MNAARRRFSPVRAAGSSKEGTEQFRSKVQRTTTDLRRKRRFSPRPPTGKRGREHGRLLNPRLYIPAESKIIILPSTAISNRVGPERGRTPPGDGCHLPELRARAGRELDLLPTKVPGTTTVLRRKRRFSPRPPTGKRGREHGRQSNMEEKLGPKGATEVKPA